MSKTEMWSLCSFLLVLIAGCGPGPKAPEPKSYALVEAQLDSTGKPTRLSVIEGDPKLHKAALEAAKSVAFSRDCDIDGKPIPSTRGVSIWFRPDGKLLKSELVPMVASRLGGSKLVRHVQPEYPKAAKRARIQGMVLLKVWKDEKGNATRLEPVRGHPLLIPPAMKAVRQWKWAPIYFNCEPVASVATVTVNFVIP